ncbi:MAG: class I SAM-dependent methyltransferase, partial [Desulfobacterales bacterium]|nr:class I SAM-dependent methyltransferase [Desulfobacterales bacterium]
MKRLSKIELELLLACPGCGEGLIAAENNLRCETCGANYGFFRGRPVALREDNELFPASAYRGTRIQEKPATVKVAFFHRLKRLVPGKSVNLAREKMFHRLATEHRVRGSVILVVGCGNQAGQLKAHFSGDKTAFVFCDIDKRADADVFCDSHELSFGSEVFDGVISTAVLEHVLYPDKVISEIYRVLKQDGFIYAEIPFLQSVHEGAYDFTRFTLSGHRRLMERFKEIDTGMVAGPGTALVWSIVDFSKALSSNRRISNLLALAARTGFFWLKYFDYLVKE